MRYRGQETRLPIAEPPDGDFPAAFAREHQRLFNFTFPGRPIESYAARVELATVGGTLPDHPASPPASPPTHSFTTSVYFFDGGWQTTPVFERHTLTPGASVAGPAIVLEPVATVVIEPGWAAETTRHNDLVLTQLRVLRPAVRENRATSRDYLPPSSLPADPVELELFHHRFASVAEQMGVVLQRTALSTNVKERLDFSCALFDAAGSLVANAAHIPVHLGAMQECVRCLREDVSAMRPGEVYVTNDPFRAAATSRT